MVLLARVIVAVSALGLTTAVPAARQAARLDLIGLIDSYAQGRHDEAIAGAAALPDLGPLRLRFVQDVPAWVVAEPANAAKRRAAAAGFIVELTAARLESDWGRLSDLLEWTCAQVLRPAGTPTEFERAWHMSTTALAGRARARVWLLGPFARLPHQKPRKPQPDDPPSPMHLTHALERFPDDPQFALARVVAWTWGRDAEPIRNLRRNEDDVARLLRAPQIEALTAYQPLLAIPAVAGEAQVRTGLVHISMANHAAALRAFEAAQPVASDRELKYLAHFLAGRSLDALQRPDEAIAQYQSALTVEPSAESAAIALAALQFSHGDRDAAVRLIDKTFEASRSSTDPGRLTGYGFYLRWPPIKAAMRAELVK
jgi:hypothetical protein